jgi:hypothetical protein
VLAAGVAGVLFCGAAFAQEEQKKDRETEGDKSEEKKIEELIKNLGSEKFKEREAAQKGLIEIGKAAVPQIEQALKSKDLGVCTRAERILLKLEPKRIGGLAKGIDVRFVKQWNGRLSGTNFKKRRYFTIRKEAEWADLWKKHTNSFHLKHMASLPKVDFDKNTVIAVFAGIDAPEIESLDITLFEKKIVVDVTDRAPAVIPAVLPPGVKMAKREGSPPDQFHRIVVIEKSPLPVVFIENNRVEIPLKVQGKYEVTLDGSYFSHLDGMIISKKKEWESLKEFFKNRDKLPAIDFEKCTAIFVWGLYGKSSEEKDVLKIETGEIVKSGGELIVNIKKIKKKTKSDKPDLNRAQIIVIGKGNPKLLQIQVIGKNRVFQDETPKKLYSPGCIIVMPKKGVSKKEIEKICRKYNCRIADSQFNGALYTIAVKHGTEERIANRFRRESQVKNVCLNFHTYRR